MILFVVRLFTFAYEIPIESQNAFQLNAHKNTNTFFRDIFLLDLLLVLLSFSLWILCIVRFIPIRFYKKFRIWIFLYKICRNAHAKMEFR